MKVGVAYLLVRQLFPRDQLLLPLLEQPINIKYKYITNLVDLNDQWLFKCVIPCAYHKLYHFS
jgi:hypothetical protein